MRRDIVTPSKRTRRNSDDGYREAKKVHDKPDESDSGDVCMGGDVHMKTGSGEEDPLLG